MQAGAHIKVDGTGQAQDPFVISSDISIGPVAGSIFVVTMSGLGTTASPWAFAVGWASTAKLDDIPDVNAPTPTNAQVLGWDSATSEWTARAPTTAASGSVLTDTSLTGDGSSGAHLAVAEDPDGYLETTASGVGITDDGKNAMVLHYASDAVRLIDTLVPHINSLSTLDDTPGVTWYWTGTQWLIVTNGIARDFGSSQLLAMSGPYAGGVTTQMIRQVSVITAVDGTFDVLSASDLTSAAGVLSCVFQETGSVPFKTMVTPTMDSIQGTAYRLDDGTAYGSQAVTGLAVAYLY